MNVFNKWFDLKNEDEGILMPKHFKTKDWNIRHKEHYETEKFMIIINHICIDYWSRIFTTTFAVFAFVSRLYFLIHIFSLFYYPSSLSIKQ